MKCRSKALLPANGVSQPLPRSPRNQLKQCTKYFAKKFLQQKNPETAEDFPKGTEYLYGAILLHRIICFFLRTASAQLLLLINYLVRVLSFSHIRINNFTQNSCEFGTGCKTLPQGT